jgi:hypothetical protein
MITFNSKISIMKHALTYCLLLFLLVQSIHAQDVHGSFDSSLGQLELAPSSLSTSGLTEFGVTNGLANDLSAVAQFDFFVTDGPRGMLMPRMSSTDRLLISSPADGLIVYDITVNCFYYWDASIPDWVKMWSSGSAPNPNLWTLNVPNNEIFNTSFRQVGVGLNDPNSMLHVEDLNLGSQEAAQLIDFANNTGSTNTFGLISESVPLTDRGGQIPVDGTSSSTTGAAQEGFSRGRLGTSSNFFAGGSYRGVLGVADATVLNNFDNTAASNVLGGYFLTSGDGTPTNLTLDNVGQYLVGGSYSLLSGTINGGAGIRTTTGDPGAVAGVIGFDQNLGNAQSYSGFFWDESYSGSGDPTREAGVLSEYNVPGLFQDVPAILGINTVEDFWGIGVKGEGGAIGVYGLNEADGSNSGFAYIGVQGDANLTTGACGNFIGYGTYGRSFNFDTNQGLRGEARDGVTNYGVYGEASSSCAGAINYAGYFNGSVFSTAGYLSSDAKFKRSVKPLNDAMSQIMQLRPSSYQYNQKGFEMMQFEEVEQFGFVAQELQAVFPNLVKESVHMYTEGEDEKTAPAKQVDFLAINYTALIPVLTKGMQEQQTTIEEQADMIEDLLSKNEGLEDRLAKLEALVANSIESRTEENAIQTIRMSDAQLQQNEPNPFQANTTIRYFIPQQVQQAQLQIADASGKIIRTIEVAARGKGQTTLETTQLTSGNYFYTLILDGQPLATKQMMLK